MWRFIFVYSCICVCVFFSVSVCYWIILQITFFWFVWFDFKGKKKIKEKTFCWTIQKTVRYWPISLHWYVFVCKQNDWLIQMHIPIQQIKRLPFSNGNWPLEFHFEKKKLLNRFAYWHVSNIGMFLCVPISIAKKKNVMKKQEIRLKSFTPNKSYFSHGIYVFSPSLA